MKDNKIITKDLKTLLKRYSKNDSITNIANNYNEETIKKINPELIFDSKCSAQIKFNEDEKRSYEEIFNEGLYRPIVVRAIDKGYELIVGQGLLIGAKKAKAQYINCIVKNFNDEESLLFMGAYLREQKNIEIVKIAIVCSYLKKDFNYKNKDLSILLKQSPAQISNILQLLQLDTKILRMISKKEISYGQAKAFSRLDKNQIEIVVNKIINEKLSVRETERLVRSFYKNEEIHDNEIITKNKITLVFSDSLEKEKALKRINKLIKKGKIKLK